MTEYGPVDQTRFVFEEPLFEKLVDEKEVRAKAPVATSSSDQEDEQAVAAATAQAKRRRWLLVGGGVVLASLLILVLVIAVVMNSQLDNNVPAPSPSARPQTEPTQLRQRLSDLEAELEAVDPARPALSLPLVESEIWIDQPDERR